MATETSERQRALKKLTALVTRIRHAEWPTTGLGIGLKANELDEALEQARAVISKAEKESSLLPSGIRKQVLRRTVTIKRLVELAGDLLGDDEDNVEYRRALGELVCDAMGLPISEYIDAVIAEIQWAAMGKFGRRAQ